ncbi:hypothetical protein RPB_2171 [Rhodopseudomonas palustris HaA2]|uniref:Uncharacterized protein n=1 Tax=Rhodopseudomonas palustris (strain HaA2) TaxID=316058 RepID=Q2IY33_RHOP2|nr:hypothetical protein [Rhodopseudomonas palustris]ABD06877.1 hypothetical protein RPB_2171 [Rhodopseudomonas palustris HaA2]
MWAFSVGSPRFADERLASISVDSSANLLSENGFGIFVALWCGRIRERIEVNGQVQGVTFGFLSGELIVEPSCGRISNEGRLEVEAGRFKITQNESDQTKKDAAAGADVGFDIGKIFGLSRVAVAAGAHLSRTISKTEQKDGEYYQVYWRVADAGHNFWRVHGIGLNADGVLENRIIGGTPLCFIVSDSQDPIEISVSYRCDLRDLWFQRDEFAYFTTDARFERDQEERNRAAVAGRVVAIALNRRSGQSSLNSIGQIVTLARQKVRAEKNTLGASNG